MPRPIRVVSVVGTRPNFMKTAPVVAGDGGRTRSSPCWSTAASTTTISLPVERSVPPHWDGKAAARIVDVLASTRPSLARPPARALSVG
jgi:hypothetical protein